LDSSILCKLFTAIKKVSLGEKPDVVRIRKALEKNSIRWNFQGPKLAETVFGGPDPAFLQELAAIGPMAGMRYAMKMKVSLVVFNLFYMQYQRGLYDNVAPATWVTINDET
jgi:hypothetical protein